MADSEHSPDINFLGPLLHDLFVIDAVYRHGRRIVVTMSYRYERQRTNKLFRERLRLSGYSFTLHESDEHLTLTIDPRRRFRIPVVNLVLFVLTLFSVYFVPVFFKSQAGAATWSEVMDRTLGALGRGAGLEFTLAMISILFVHEMGHFAASRRRGIVTSWPYFIPAPNIIGTFGAIIKSKSPFWNRRDLIEVGAAGPIAGWVVAIAWLIYGLSRSVILPSELVPIDQLAFSLEGESLLMRFLVPIFVGSAPPGSFYVFTEAAFAGWVGLLVTAMNLLPVGQFDGGHIVYGLTMRRQKVLGWIAMIGLLAMGFGSPVWWVFAAFGFIFGVAHPPTMDDRRATSPTARAMGIAAMVILLISFTPVPFR
ncbi:MAG TPA: site-2 protease family protein [Acidobacteriota bacterium]|nr:site-2 protease family protein [Acidobacteriota bacterium]